MVENPNTKRLIEIIEPIVESHGADLVDIEYAGNTRSQVVRIFVNTDTGIRLEQCERISRDIADMLDQKNIIPNRYRLEVSSPGLDRPLKTMKDFRRQLGRKIAVSYSPAQGEMKSVSGIIEQVDEASVIVATEKEQIRIDLATISLAKIVPVW
ncbi:MAG: ribosome maturation factor RimP [Candidatus Zhuqueibacterota bacterium]